MAQINMLLLSCFLILTKSALAHCQSDWAPYTDKFQIKAFPDYLSYNEAIDFCASHEGSTLVTVRSAEMQRILSTYTANIPDSFWLGGRFDRTTSQFVWQDGEPLGYTNWQSGYPVSIPLVDNCVEVQPLSSTSQADRKWANVVCQVRNQVICQRLKAGPTLEELAGIVMELQNELAAVSNRVVPLGSIYIEYYGQPSPRSLWPDLMWQDISNTYAGYFFRAYGGTSSGWGTVQPACAPRITQMHLQTRAGGAYSSPLTIPQSGWSDYGTAGYFWNSGEVYNENLRFFTESCEVRPRNQAIRIWKRVLD